jgi:hypothetical protein
VVLIAVRAKNEVAFGVVPWGRVRHDPLPYTVDEELVILSPASVDKQLVPLHRFRLPSPGHSVLLRRILCGEMDRKLVVGGIVIPDEPLSYASLSHEVLVADDFWVHTEADPDLERELALPTKGVP